MASPGVWGRRREEWGASCCGCSPWRQWPAERLRDVAQRSTPRTRGDTLVRGNVTVVRSLLARWQKHRPYLEGAVVSMSARPEDSLYYKRTRRPPQPNPTTNNVGLFLLAFMVLAIIAAAALLGPDVLREFRSMVECWQNPELAVC